MTSVRADVKSLQVYMTRVWTDNKPLHVLGKQKSKELAVLYYFM